MLRIVSWNRPTGDCYLMINWFGKGRELGESVCGWLSLWGLLGLVVMIEWWVISVVGWLQTVIDYAALCQCTALSAQLDVHLNVANWEGSTKLCQLCGCEAIEDKPSFLLYSFPLINSRGLLALYSKNKVVSIVWNFKGLCASYFYMFLVYYFHLGVGLG
jgi:hypothetical protein